MYKKPTTTQQMSFMDLESMLNPKHTLFVLANIIDWNMFEDSFAPSYHKNNGRPAKPIRLMVGLLMLKHLRNISDESVVEQFQENAYYQYFCGLKDFVPAAPCDPTELVYFRRRIKEEGVELILKESIRVNLEIEAIIKRKENEKQGKSNRGRKPDSEQIAFIDSTVQEKNVTFPTDSKLLNKVIETCLKISAAEGIKLRQTYAKEIKGLKLDQRFRGKKGSAKKVKKADKRMRTIAGRLVKELTEKLPSENQYQELLEICSKVVKQEKLDGHKIYSIHEPHVECIAKGKESKKYEFGNKVSIVRLWSGLIIGALSFRNEYDGHTIDKSLEQTNRIYGKPIKTLAGDRGYRGQKESGTTNVLIPDVRKPEDTPYESQKKHNLFRKRAGIEPTIGHCKSDHRLGRNFYKGLHGDSINVMLSAAAFNLKRAMNILKRVKDLFLRLFSAIANWLQGLVNTECRSIEMRFLLADNSQQLTGRVFQA